jgi:hypothetical protein
VGDERSIAKLSFMRAYKGDLNVAACIAGVITSRAESAICG